MTLFVSIVILSITLNESVSALSGVTTRYWDCCKPSCSWRANVASGVNPVKTCQKDGTSPGGENDMSACSGDAGIAYMCESNSPRAIDSNHAIGFVAGSIAGLSMQDACCTCWTITFTSTSIAGKTMTVQMTNTGSDLGTNHFDIQMPGGGVGLFDGCSKQYDYDTAGNKIYPGSYRWGQRYGGINDRSQCDSLPEGLKPGCYWRFDWFQNADNPNMDFSRAVCPDELTSITGCVRNP